MVEKHFNRTNHVPQQDSSISLQSSFVMTEAKNPNYIYMATMTMTYLEALQNFRSGLRSGDMEKITSAKAIFVPLFHARHHPHYQEIEMVEAVQRQSVPQDVKPFFDQTESVCLSEDKMSGMLVFCFFFHFLNTSVKDHERS